MRSLVLMAVLMTASGSCWDTSTPEPSPTEPLVGTSTEPPASTPTVEPPTPTDAPVSAYPTPGECPTPRALQKEELVPMGTVFRAAPVVD